MELTKIVWIFCDRNPYRAVRYFRTPIIGVKYPVNPIYASDLQWSNLYITQQAGIQDLKMWNITLSTMSNDSQHLQQIK